MFCRQIPIKKQPCLLPSCHLFSFLQFLTCLQNSTFLFWRANYSSTILLPNSPIQRQPSSLWVFSTTFLPNDNFTSQKTEERVERHVSLGSVLTARTIHWEGESERPPSRGSLECSNSAPRTVNEGDLWKPGEVECTANPVSQDKRKCSSCRAKEA